MNHIQRKKGTDIHNTFQLDVKPLEGVKTHFTFEIGSTNSQLTDRSSGNFTGVQFEIYAQRDHIFRRHCEGVNMTKKQLLTIDHLLDDYFYAEWIRDDLRDIGLSTSGSKAQLIVRYIERLKSQRQSVKDAGIALISSLPLQELRMIANDFGIPKARNREALLREIIEHVNFEPYVKMISRPCLTCKTTTGQEVHFDDNFDISYYQCTVCNKKEMSEWLLREYGLKDEPGQNRKPSGANVSISFELANQKNDEDGVEGNMSKIMPRQTSEAAVTVAVALTTTAVAVFSAALFGFERLFGWITGFGLAIIAAISATAVLLLTRKLWLIKLSDWLTSRVQ